MKADDTDHLDAGILGAKAVLDALSENGYAGIAYKIASQETAPSWGWWMLNGATTLYENWNIYAASDLSLNHIMFGEIGAWLFKGLGGIKIDPAHPGFKNIKLEPHFVEGLDQYESFHDGPFGRIISSWKKSEMAIIYSAVIPANSTAMLSLEITKGQKVYLNGKIIDVTKPVALPSGKYMFEIR